MEVENKTNEGIMKLSRAPIKATVLKRVLSEIGTMD